MGQGLKNTMHIRAVLSSSSAGRPKLPSLWRSCMWFLHGTPRFRRQHLRGWNPSSCLPARRSPIRKSRYPPRSLSWFWWSTSSGWGRWWWWWRCRRLAGEDQQQLQPGKDQGGESLKGRGGNIQQCWMMCQPAKEVGGGCLGQGEVQQLESGLCKQVQDTCKPSWSWLGTVGG